MRILRFLSLSTWNFTLGFFPLALLVSILAFTLRPTILLGITQHTWTDSQHSGMDGGGGGSGNDGGRSEEAVLRILRSHLNTNVVEAEKMVELSLQVELKEGYRAYQNKFQIEVTNLENFKSGHLLISPLRSFLDPATLVSKKGVIGRAQLKMSFEAPTSFIFTDTRDQESKITFRVNYQTCTEKRCLFPSFVDLSLPVVRFVPRSHPSLLESKGVRPERIEIGTGTGTGVETSVPLSPSGASEVSSLILVFLAGLLAGLTPCIFPMIPITLAVMGRGGGKSLGVLGPVLGAYVGGISLAYASLGLVAAWTGSLFGAWISSPYVTGAAALIFLLGALSLFWDWDFFTSFSHLSHRLTDGLIRRWKSSSLETSNHPESLGLRCLSAGLSGVSAGLLASPCVSPALIALLTHVAQRQDSLSGFGLLFLFSLGLCTPLILVGILGGTPRLLGWTLRPGSWMRGAKVGLGLLMLGVSIYYGKLLFSSSGNGFGEDPRMNSENSEKTSIWKKYTSEDLDLALRSGHPVLLDLYATWCSLCHQLDASTFSHPGFLDFIQSPLQPTWILLRLDASHPSPDLKDLQKKYSVLGLPTLLIFDLRGRWRSDLTLNEFESGPQLVERLKRVLASKPNP